MSSAPFSAKVKEKVDTTNELLDAFVRPIDAKSKALNWTSVLAETNSYTPGETMWFNLPFDIIDKQQSRIWLEIPGIRFTRNANQGALVIGDDRDIASAAQFISNCKRQVGNHHLPQISDYNTVRHQTMKGISNDVRRSMIGKAMNLEYKVTGYANNVKTETLTHHYRILSAVNSAVCTVDDVDNIANATGTLTLYLDISDDLFEGLPVIPARYMPELRVGYQLVNDAQDVLGVGVDNADLAGLNYAVEQRPRIWYRTVSLSEDSDKKLRSMFASGTQFTYKDVGSVFKTINDPSNSTVRQSFGALPASVSDLSYVQRYTANQQNNRMYESALASLNSYQFVFKTDNDEMALYPKQKFSINEGNNTHRLLQYITGLSLVFNGDFNYSQTDEFLHENNFVNQYFALDVPMDLQDFTISGKQISGVDAELTYGGGSHNMLHGLIYKYDALMELDNVEANSLF